MSKYKPSSSLNLPFINKSASFPELVKLCATHLARHGGAICRQFHELNATLSIAIYTA